MKSFKDKTHFPKNSINNLDYENFLIPHNHNLNDHINEDYNDYKEDNNFNDYMIDGEEFNYSNLNDDDFSDSDFSINWIDDLKFIEEDEGYLNKDNIFRENNLLPFYMVNHKSFSPDEEILLENIRSQLVDLAISSKQTKEIAKVQDIKNILKEKFNENMDINYLEDLSLRIYENINGYGLINPLILDDDLEEIMVIGSNKPVYVYHRNHGMMETNLIFDRDVDIIRIIDSIARSNNRRFDSESPIFDGRLKDGSRVNGTLPPISADGPTLTIRKFKQDSYTIIDLINSNTLDSTLASFLWLAIDGLGVKSSNILISGGTSSGKTTTLNALAGLINPKERIISIEDTLELQIPHKHTIRMETRLANIEGKGELNMDDLLKNALRQRPDRIIVGEVRGSEAITLFTALNTGHSGFGTLHANNGRETISRLVNPPMNVPKIMITSLDFILMQKRIYLPNGMVYRRVTELSEVVGLGEGNIQLNELFRWNPSYDKFEKVGISSKSLEILASMKGLTKAEIDFEINKRKSVFDLMAKNNYRSNKLVSKILESYYINSDKVLDDLIQRPNCFI
ncbi:CpaF family protein [uncultured Methanobrevibacter sp.]|uniref:CpaF family protein n=1 Tax=uncultured Methanobrevibacter sp. TaxID=253161 RepID=UPI0025D9F134|nr:CpaF family protein [uncultured Methanobrevibacter sp.]